MTADNDGMSRLQGDGVLVSLGGLTLLCAPTPGQHASIGALVGTLATAAMSAPAGGRRWSELLGGVLTSGDTTDFPALAAFGPTGNGFAAIVYGPAELILTIGGRELRVDGRGSMTLVDRYITEPVDAIRAVLGNAGDGLQVTWSSTSAGTPTAPSPPHEPMAAGHVMAEPMVAESVMAGPAMAAAKMVVEPVVAGPAMMAEPMVAEPMVAEPMVTGAAMAAAPMVVGPVMAEHMMPQSMMDGSMSTAPTMAEVMSHAPTMAEPRVMADAMGHQAMGHGSLVLAESMGHGSMARGSSAQVMTAAPMAAEFGPMPSSAELSAMAVAEAAHSMGPAVELAVEPMRTMVGPMAAMAEPMVAEPTMAVPTMAAEPMTADPAMAEPMAAMAESMSVQPMVAEPMPAEPMLVQPMIAAPLMAAEPVMAEPVMAEPVMAEPMVVAPARPEQIVMTLRMPPATMPEQVMPLVEPMAEPMPMAEAVAQPVIDRLGTTPPAPGYVIGVYCKKNHFNDPRVAYCAACGLSMLDSHAALVWGLRPQLGVLVLDDGTVSPFDRDHVVGSLPDRDPMVVADLASPVRLQDPLLSPVHTRLVIEGWDVRVIAEASGVFVRGPGEVSWNPLAKGGSATLRTGSVVACGRRQLHYHSYRSLLR